MNVVMRKYYFKLSIIIIPYLIFCCILFPQCATALNDVTSKIVYLGQPFDNSSYARNVWDMQLYEGRLYLGCGDLVSNTGPVPVISLDPANGIFKNEYAVDEEQIDSFEVLDNKLYIPGTDATESWDYGNYYVLEGSWQKHRTIPRANHVFDLAYYRGQLYAASSSTSVSCTIMSSKDSGKTWSTQVPADGSLNVYDYCAYTLFEFKGRLYAASELFYSDTNKYNNLLVMDGNTSQTLKVSGKKMLPGGSGIYHYRIIRPLEINNKLVYIGAKVANGMQWVPDRLYVTEDMGQSTRVEFPEAEALVSDVLNRGEETYALTFVKEEGNRYTNIVYRSPDLQTWSELFRFSSDAFARSFEELNGDFYVGMGCYIGESTLASSGKVFKIPLNSYKPALSVI